MDSQHVGLLEQYTTLEYILLGDLRDLLEEDADEENRRWMLAVLDALLETLPREFSLKDEDGYMSEVLEQFPSWSGQVERLHHDHDRLFVNLQALRQRVHSQAWLAPIASQVRRDLREWMLTLIAHHRAETRLMQTALNLEVGAGD